jgi:uncharacterized membrane protein
MAFCPNCGSQATGTFCPNCGTSLGGAPPPPPNTGTAPNAGYAAPQAVSAAGLTDNVAGALCYLFTFITGIIFLVLAPYNQNKFVRFHAFQSIFLFVAWIALSILLGLLAVVTHGLGVLLYPLLSLAGFVLWLYMMFSAYNGKRIKLPLVGDLAEKQA